MNDWYRLTFSADDISAAKHLEMEGHFEKFFLAAGSPEDATLFKGLEPGQIDLLFLAGSGQDRDEAHYSPFGCTVSGSANVGGCVYSRPSGRSVDSACFDTK